MNETLRKNSQKPRLLLTNDDGIFAPGLRQLAATLSETNRFVLSVAAPAAERSGVGHALTLREPLHVRPVTTAAFLGPFAAAFPNVAFPCWAVDGTPADCVKIALTELFRDAKPDLVVSGINGGLNIGVNVFYSGTVAAAFEAVFCGVSSVALSAEHPGNGQTWRFESAARRVLPLLETVLARSLAQGVILNVNVPNLPDENVRGLRLTRHGRSGFEEFYTEQENVEDRGDEVRRFLLDGVMRHRDGDDDCADAEAVRRGWISVTPMTPCLDDDQSRRTLHGWPLFERR